MTIDKYEQYRKVYSFEIPTEVILDMLTSLGWSQCGGESDTPLVAFHEVSDTEDSYFSVLGHGDWKDNLAEATKKAYFAMVDRGIESRRKQYEELKAEFETEVKSE